MEYMKIIKIMIALIITTVIIIFGWNFYEGNKNTSQNSQTLDTRILGNSQDLVSFSVSSGDTVSGVLNVVGSVQGGYFFEGNILVNILDLNKKIIRNGNGNAITDWATLEPVGFNAALDFSYLPSGPAYIEIHNDNPGAPNEGINKSILIPIIIK